MLGSSVVLALPQRCCGGGVGVEVRGRSLGQDAVGGLPRSWDDLHDGGSSLTASCCGARCF